MNAAAGGGRPRGLRFSRRDPAESLRLKPSSIPEDSFSSSSSFSPSYSSFSSSSSSFSSLAAASIPQTRGSAERNASRLSPELRCAGRRLPEDASRRLRLLRSPSFSEGEDAHSDAGRDYAKRRPRAAEAREYKRLRRGRDAETALREGGDERFGGRREEKKEDGRQTAFYAALQEGVFAQRLWRVIDPSGPWLLKCRGFEEELGEDSRRRLDFAGATGRDHHEAREEERQEDEEAEREEDEEEETQALSGESATDAEESNLAAGLASFALSSAALVRRVSSLLCSASAASTSIQIASAEPAGAADESPPCERVLVLSEVIEGILPLRVRLPLSLLSQSAAVLRQQLFLPSLALLAVFQRELAQLHAKVFPAASAAEEEGARGEEALAKRIRKAVAVEFLAPALRVAGESAAASALAPLLPSRDLTTSLTTPQRAPSPCAAEATSPETPTWPAELFRWTRPTAAAYSALTAALLPPPCRADVYSVFSSKAASFGSLDFSASLAPAAPSSLAPAAPSSFALRRDERKVEKARPPASGVAVERHAPLTKPADLFAAAAYPPRVAVERVEADGDTLSRPKAEIPAMRIVVPSLETRRRDTGGRGRGLTLAASEKSLQTKT
ncbi:hypothetical protein BESB_021830 [Besnoitia besnoiti]|uniref:Uncharacterized protein n=1 Tax=Besnoitia besnoiti TaxID=94643 RepID=A0A2A9MA25_BESBE|nr:hypothetical protein BESB_021830 [Besnoitia besnoiti]PFH32242.1 hypothetical protein BESB_021830 [Besnoitia besnoiti]